MQFDNDFFDELFWEEEEPERQPEAGADKADGENVGTEGKDVFADLESIFQPEIKADDDDYQPIGLGRKSRYAVSRKLPDDRIRSVEVDPEPAEVPRRARRTVIRETPVRPPVGTGTAERRRKITAKETPEEPRTVYENTRRQSGTSFAENMETAKEAVGIFMNNAKEKKADKEKQKVYTIRRGRRGRAKPVSDAISRYGSGRGRKRAKKRRSRADLTSFFYLAAMAVGGVFKALFGTRRRRIATAAIVCLLLAVWGVSSAVTFYKSNTALADQGKDIDEEAIIERKVTDAENKDKVTYFLIAGVDKSSRLTDCIWVMCLDNVKHTMNVLQIPRDTYVGDDSIAPHKFNAVYESPKTVNWCESCGREVAVEEIEPTTGNHIECGQEVGTKRESNMNAMIRVINNRLKLPVDHYVLFDFKGFEKVIDAMGGVDIVLENEMRVYPNKTDYVTLDAGLNHLDGATALKFMRNRKIYADGDLGRVKAQRQLIHALLEKVDGMSVVSAFNVLMAAKDYFKTDMSVDDITSFISPVKKCHSEDLHMFELPGEAGTRRRTSYYFCDEEKTAEALNEYMLPYSDKLTAEDIDFPER